MEKCIMLESRYMELEQEVIRLLTDLGMAPGTNQSHISLKEAILMAVQSPDSWKEFCLECIAQRENVTRETIRRMIHRAAWDNWNVKSKGVLECHFNRPIQIKFEYSKPNHTELITLISGELRKNISNESPEDINGEQ